MRVVIDTNVLLSALISPAGNPGVIVRAWRSGRFFLFTSAEQLDELRRASRYDKFKTVLQPHRVGKLVNEMRKDTLVKIYATAGIPEIADPSDTFLLALARAASADYLVTGDRRAGLLRLDRFEGTRIVTPQAFSALL